MAVEDWGVDVWDDCWYDDFDDELSLLENAKVVHFTKKAILVLKQNGQTAWFPKVAVEFNGNEIWYYEWFLPQWSMKKRVAIEGDFI